MTRIVTDASVSLRWCFGDGSHSDQKFAKAVLVEIQSGRRIVVPPVWPLEIGNVLARAIKDGIISEAQASQYLLTLAGLSIEVEQEKCTERALVETFAIATNFSLSTYDASYLELAMSDKLVLATLDQKLRKVAAKLQVTLFDG